MVKVIHTIGNHQTIKSVLNDIENFTLMFDKYQINENFKESLYNIIDYNLPFKKK